MSHQFVFITGDYATVYDRLSQRDRATLGVGSNVDCCKTLQQNCTGNGLQLVNKGSFRLHIALNELDMVYCPVGSFLLEFSYVDG